MLKLKTCSKCKLQKPLDQYNKESRNKDGKRTYCKDCERPIRELEKKRVIENRVTLTHKECSLCKNTLPANMFGKNIGRRSGLSESCKPCRNPRTVASRFGLSTEEYLFMKSRVNNSCEICGKLDNHLAVDHCHNTGKIRGMLCTNCNNGLGRFKDNIHFLKNAIDYLTKNKGE